MGDYGCVLHFIYFLRFPTCRVYLVVLYSADRAPLPLCPPFTKLLFPNTRHEGSDEVSKLCQYSFIERKPWKPDSHLHDASKPQ